jgi:shikimate 5-dehydrogenase
MFIEQAARQFEIFTGENAPRAVMQQAAREALAEQFNHSLSHG